MSETYITVNFEIHVPESSVQSMVTGMAAYGNVTKTGITSEYRVEIFRASKLPRLSKQLTSWENYGYLKWQQEL